MESNRQLLEKPLRVPQEGEKVYHLTGEQIREILAMRGSSIELDPGMGGVSPEVLDNLLQDESELVSVDLALTSACNFKCEWCYRPGEEWGNLLLNFDDIFHIVHDAAELGVRFFILTGGEPTMYNDKRAGKKFFDVVDLIQQTYARRNMDVDVLTFTDVALIDEKTAEKFAERKVALCLKRDTLDHRTQDLIVGANFGIKNGSRKMEKGYEYLFNAGYGKDSNLAVSVNTVLGTNIITQEGSHVIDTLKGAVDLHYWVRGNGMEHSIVPIHYCGEAQKENQVAGIHPLQIKALYDVLAVVDDVEFNDSWTVYSGFPKNKTCNRPGRGIHIRATGKVTSCSESPLVEKYVFGDIRETRLTTIVRSDHFQNFRGEFAKREGKYICNPNACDLNANNLCRGGCATRSAYSVINPETGLIEQNSDPLAYTQGREDPLCPGWAVLAQKQGVLKNGLYEQVVDQLLVNSSLKPKLKSEIRRRVVANFQVLRNTM